jgi:PAS domain-containing protein
MPLSIGGTNIVRAVLPANEPERLAALDRYAILDTPVETKFDRLSRVAGRVFDAPIALISLLDGKRQFLKSHIGLDVTETPRDQAFCAHAILQDTVLVVPDAAVDDRFADNALVTGQPHIRFYAGAPLKTADGFNLGTLCVIDRVPHPHPNEQQLAILQDLSAQVVELLEAGRSRHEVLADRVTWLKTEKMAALALDAGNMGFWEWNAQTGLSRCSERMFDIIRLPSSETVPVSEELLRRVHPDDRSGLLEALGKPKPGSDRLDTKFRIVDPDGAERYITLMGVYSFDQNGPGQNNVLRGALGIGWDSTDSDKKERALAESEDRFRGLSSSCPVGIFRTDLNAR